SDFSAFEPGCLSLFEPEGVIAFPLPDDEDALCIRVAALKNGGLFLVMDAECDIRRGLQLLLLLRSKPPIFCRPPSAEAAACDLTASSRLLIDLSTEESESESSELLLISFR